MTLNHPMTSKVVKHVTVKSYTSFIHDGVAVVLVILYHSK